VVQQPAEEPEGPEISNTTSLLRAGSSHVCILRDGVPKCWGDNHDGQLGRSDVGDSHVATPIQGLESGVIALSTGDHFTCAVAQNGSLWCVGQNDQGQLLASSLAQSGQASSVVPIQAAIAGQFDQVATGYSGGCVRHVGGRILCWGRLLNGANSSANIAAREVSALGLDTTALAAGAFHACALRSPGTVWCWGSNGNRQVGVATLPPSLVVEPQRVTVLGDDVAQVSLGGHHSCAVKNDGALYCWGESAMGYHQMTVAIPTRVNKFGNDVKMVAAGNNFTCVLNKRGAVYCYGENLNGKAGADPGPPAYAAPYIGVADAVRVIARDATEVVAGTGHACAVKTDGSVWCWGNNSSGQLGVAKTLRYSFTPQRVTSL
jgi:alpha-tubulin suppressor-like RCC1 family protein